MRKKTTHVMRIIRHEEYKCAVVGDEVGRKGETGAWKGGGASLARRVEDM